MDPRTRVAALRRNQFHILVAWVLAVSCEDANLAGDEGVPPPMVPSWQWNLPTGVAKPNIPANNPMTREKVELGRRLFFDRRLSANRQVSCRSCHDPAFAFADPRRVSEGITGATTPRNAPSLANIAYASYLTWTNLVLRELEVQAMVPLFGDNPLEMGASAELEFLEERFGQDIEYSRLFRDAYPNLEVDDRLNWETVIDALACFQRSLISMTSPYDDFLGGDEQALDASQHRGLALFESERFACSSCHRGPLLSSAFVPGQDIAKSEIDDVFRNTGLYYLPKEVGGYPAPNVGILEFTRNPEDGGKFRVPSLRNVELTAPYMHDGSIGSLEEVLEHYRVGGRTLVHEHAGVGANHPNKDPAINGFSLTLQEKTDLLAFLRSLSDWKFIGDDSHQDPFVIP